MDLSGFLEPLREIWPHLVGTATLVIDLIAAAHVVMYKKDSRAAIGWMGIIWLAPVVGALLYALLGINRVQRRAISRRGPAARPAAATPSECPVDLLARRVPEQAANLRRLAKMVGELTGLPLLDGNEIVPLDGGDEAYPEMLAAIEAAHTSIGLSSYIFSNDRAGQMFVDALARAVERQVLVRVLIDDIGARYKWPSIKGPLRRAGVRLAHFFPSLVPIWSPYFNLRNHRKLLIVDGQLGFTGGMNIREGHYFALQPRYRIQDLHFRLRGPVVAQLQEVFADDWCFSTGETLRGPAWFPELAPVGSVLARGISAGPDGNLDKLRLTLLGAIAGAESSLAIVTPYFLPDRSLIEALDVAALRGVQVDILLPQKSNLPLVQWACTALLWQLLQRGCHVWLTPAPFDHTKLIVVDGVWSLIGSANWDPRSLRLNFEFDVECYDLELAERLEQCIAQKRQQARRVTLADVDGRSIPIRLRDGIARLLTPYL